MNAGYICFYNINDDQIISIFDFKEDLCFQTKQDSFMLFWGVCDGVNCSQGLIDIHCDVSERICHLGTCPVSQGPWCSAVSSWDSPLTMTSQGKWSAREPSLRRTPGWPPGSSRIWDFRPILGFPHSLPALQLRSWTVPRPDLQVSLSPLCSLLTILLRMVKPRIVLLIFVSGKVVLTGAKVRQEIYEAFDNIYPILKNFKKQ